jgi:CHASE2 domain-containing sensor protein
LKAHGLAIGTSKNRRFPPQSFAELIAGEDGSYQEQGTRYISWLQTPKDGRQTFLTLSGEDVLGRGLPSPLPLKDILRGKTVLVGGNFADRDQHLTPFSVLRGEWFPGIFVHAQTLAQLSDPARRPIYVLSWPAWHLGLGCGERRRPRRAVGKAERISSLG